MLGLSPSEQEDLQFTAEIHFSDTCSIKHDTGTPTTNTYGEETTVFVETLDVPCGFMTKMETQIERAQDQVITFDSDAMLRLPLSTEISEDDEVVVRGETWEVDGVVKGRTVLLVSLKRVSTNG